MSFELLIPEEENGSKKVSTTTEISSPKRKITDDTPGDLSQRNKLCRRVKQLPELSMYRDSYDSEDEKFENSFGSLMTFEEKGMGTGVKTRKSLAKNTLLGEYNGTHLTYAKAFDKMKHNPLHYIVQTDLRNRYIDGDGENGNILKYINHKCINSNCELIKLTRGRVGIITNRRITSEEILNYDYNLTYFKSVSRKTIKCVCSIDCPNYL